ncbi:MAG: RNA polymerase sigma factor [Cyclobacteriaceae bacterium]|nr:RNA polymerase sigma factor [Cyclobacteriaceae bacterium]
MTSLEFSYKVDQLTTTLKPYALRLTKDREDANDLLQETLLKAFNNRDKFAPGTNLKAWMYTIMKNTFITNYQRMVRRNTFIDTTENLHFINSSGTITCNKAMGNFEMKDIQDAVCKLGDCYRLPFLMHFEGYKYHEIAEELCIPIGTVKNRIHIARKELKALLSIYAYKN